MLSRALALATAGLNQPPPNPRVGCVLVSPHGQIVGEGCTQKAGGHHAEVMAIRDAAIKGHSTADAIAYVTLEPCCHQGRTGPCTDALIAAGISKVVAASSDPNPLVAGDGFTRLRNAGIMVEVLPPADPLASQSRELNIGFFSRMIRKTPWVRMKIAASLDGKTALPNGVSQWITSTEARTDGHAWRARSCAILTGIGTLLADQPRLDVRLVETPRQPHVVVVDSLLQTPTTAPIFSASRSVFIYTATDDAERRLALEAVGAIVVYLPKISDDGVQTGKVDLRTMLVDLGRREINELHVEAGYGLNGALVAAGLVDEFLIYLAPKLFGQGLGLANVGPFFHLAEATALEFLSATMTGPDLRVLARTVGRGQF